MQDIKARIRWLRKQHGLTMAQFAKSIQVSPGNVGDWESEKRPSVPGAQALIQIAKTYDVSIDWLLMGAASQPAASNQSYSAYIKPEYAAHPELYQQLTELALTMTEEELLRLIQSIQQHEDYRIG